MYNYLDIMREEKNKMPVSETKRRNNDNYNAKCDAITIRPVQEIGADVRAAAAAKNQSLQRYILQALLARMERDGYQTTAPEWEKYREE